MLYLKKWPELGYYPNRSLYAVFQTLTLMKVEHYQRLNHFNVELFEQSASLVPTCIAYLHC